MYKIRQSWSVIKIKSGEKLVRSPSMHKKQLKNNRIHMVKQASLRHTQKSILHSTHKAERKTIEEHLVQRSKIEQQGMIETNKKTFIGQANRQHFPSLQWEHCSGRYVTQKSKFLSLEVSSKK